MVPKQGLPNEFDRLSEGSIKSKEITTKSDLFIVEPKD